MVAVTFKDYNVIMKSLVTSHRWLSITRQANLIVSVTDEISLFNSLKVAFFPSYHEYRHYHENWSIKHNYYLEF